MESNLYTFHETRNVLSLETDIGRNPCNPSDSSLGSLEDVSAQHRSDIYSANHNSNNLFFFLIISYKTKYGF